jgi:hypothetical protein
MREKEIVKLMPRFYRWNAYNTSMFFFVKAQLQSFPTLTIEAALNNYRKFTGITEDDWGQETMRTQYNRMQHEFYMDQKNECTEKDKRVIGSEAGADK